jgi:hypothetical protein
VRRLVVCTLLVIGALAPFLMRAATAAEDPQGLCDTIKTFGRRYAAGESPLPDPRTNPKFARRLASEHETEARFASTSVAKDFDVQNGNKVVANCQGAT